MPYVGQKPADIISTAVDTVTGKFSGEVDAASLDISGNIDVDGTTNLDVVDIDGAVDINAQTNIHSNLVLDDSNKVIIGNGSDLQLYHDGSNSYIDDAGTGSLIIRAENIIIEDLAGNNYFTGAHDGATKIYHINNTKLETATTGVNVTGGIGLGGTGTANILDDYEEGTFTPTLALSGATLASTGGTGRYTKIGRHVYVEGKVTRNTADGGANSFVQLESLPFTSLNANSITEMGSGTMFMDEGGPGVGQGDTVGHALVASNGNVASVLRVTSSGAQTSTRYGIGSEMTNGRPLYFNFVYTTA